MKKIFIDTNILAQIPVYEPQEFLDKLVYE